MSSQAKEGEDFTAVSNKFILMEDGQTTASIPLPIINDQIPELNEKFYLRLTQVTLDEGNTSDTSLMGQLRLAVVTIVTNDDAYGAFRLYSVFAGLNTRVIEVNEANRYAVDLIVERIGKLKI